MEIATSVTFLILSFMDAGSLAHSIGLTFEGFIKGVEHRETGF